MVFLYIDVQPLQGSEATRGRGFNLEVIDNFNPSIEQVKIVVICDSLPYGSVPRGADALLELILIDRITNGM